MRVIFSSQPEPFPLVADVLDEFLGSDTNLIHLFDHLPHVRLWDQPFLGLGRHWAIFMEEVGLNVSIYPILKNLLLYHLYFISIFDSFYSPNSFLILA